MTTFENRSELADRLEQTFTGAFNAACESHQIIKFGIESTKLAQAHEQLRNRYDATSRFLRYMPDSVLVSIQNQTAATALVEFKAAKTGVRYDSFFERLLARCPDMTPPFATKEDVFNVESEALNGYLELWKIGVPVIVVGHAMYRSDNPLRAQYAHRIAVCNEYDPNQGSGTTGSGTWLKNVNFASFTPLADFFGEHISPDVLRLVEQEVLRKC